MEITEHVFIDLIASEGMELWNGETATPRVSAPLGTDLSEWMERQIVIEEEEDDRFFY